MPFKNWLNPQLTMGNSGGGPDDGPGDDNGDRDHWMRRHRLWLVGGTSIVMWFVIIAVIGRVLYRLGVFGP